MVASLKGAVIERGYEGVFCMLITFRFIFYFLFWNDLQLTAILQKE